MINAQGLRQNVAIVLINQLDQVFWAQRFNDETIWQFPQGGVNEGESDQQAAYRELYEEVGLLADEVEHLAQSQSRYDYRFPPPMVKTENHQPYVGQSQRYFLFRLKVADSKINLQAHHTPEFSQWRWVSYWYPLSDATSFKKAVYQQVLNEFAGYLFQTEAIAC